MNYCNVSAAPAAWTAPDDAPVGTLVIRAFVIAIKPGATITADNWALAGHVADRCVKVSAYRGITLATARDYVMAHKDAVQCAGLTATDYQYEWAANKVVIE